jgi:hypothetical protein
MCFLRYSELIFFILTVYRSKLKNVYKVQNFIIWTVHATDYWAYGNILLTYF